MSDIIPINQWIGDGDKVLLVKCVGIDNSSRNGFKWPKSGTVETPSKRDDQCESGGLFGWPWGLNLGGGKDPDFRGNWIVFAAPPSEVIMVGNDKCKVCPKKGDTIARAEVLFCGNWNEALRYCALGREAWIKQAAKDSQATGDRSASAATGNQSASAATGYWSASAATGDRSASAATGYWSASAATGDRSASAATGYQSASAATGDRSASAATGYRSASAATGNQSASAATGDCTAAISTGTGSKAKAGKYGVIALAWWNEKENRAEMKCAEIGCGDGSDGKLKADTWYSLTTDGKFQEAQK